MTPQRIFQLLCNALLGLCLCLQGSAQAEGTSKAAYTQAKQQWQAAGIHDYQFNLTQHCFCMGENNGAIRITVKNDAVQSAIWTNNGKPVSADVRKQLPSMAGIFQKIEEGYAKPADEIRLTFNKDYGYPEHVYIDYVKMMADEELIYTLSDFSR